MTHLIFPCLICPFRQQLNIRTDWVIMNPIDFMLIHSHCVIKASKLIFFQIIFNKVVETWYKTTDFYSLLYLLRICFLYFLNSILNIGYTSLLGQKVW